MNLRDLFFGNRESRESTHATVINTYTGATEFGHVEVRLITGDTALLLGLGGIEKGYFEVNSKRRNLQVGQRGWDATVGNKKFMGISSFRNGARS